MVFNPWIEKGRLVMIPLLACSLISLALTIERLIFWTRLKSKDVVHEVLRFVGTGESEQTLKLGRTSELTKARILAARIARWNPAPGSV